MDRDFVIIGLLLFFAMLVLFIFGRRKRWMAAIGIVLIVTSFMFNGLFITRPSFNHTTTAAIAVTLGAGLFAFDHLRHERRRRRSRRQQEESKA